MSVCPNCHQMEKPFMAAQCNECNEVVGFFEQCFISLTYTVFYIGTIWLAGWLLLSWIF
jgi:hypothetical protein